MAASVGDNFETWLLEKLSSVSSEFDTDVFITYIITILEEEDPDDDKIESITELLAGVVEADVAADTCKSILDEWKVNCDRNKNNHVVEDMGDKLSEILGKQTLATVKEKTLTSEEKARKEAILAHYAHISDGEESDKDDFEADMEEHSTSKHKSKQNPSDSSLLMKNVNKEDVQKAEREMREKSKLEAEKKKEKDKQDRQAQKQKVQDRKETEKKRTQKGEKRR